MARIRTIKPEFFTNTQLNRLTPLHRLFFIGLWTQADREGRLKDDPDRLKIVLVPSDSCDADKICSDLVTANLIIRYHVKGETFIVIPTFTQHQRPNSRELPSIFPAPPKHHLNHSQASSKSFQNALEGKGRERERKETPLPPLPKFEALISDPTFLTQLTTDHPTKNVAAEIIKMRNWLKYNRAKKNWIRFINNWLLNARDPKPNHEDKTSAALREYQAKRDAEKQPTEKAIPQ